MSDLTASEMKELLYRAANRRTRKELEAEVEQVRKALDFYADPENYKGSGWQGDPDPSMVMTDQGRIARAALKEAGAPASNEKRQSGIRLTPRCNDCPTDGQPCSRCLQSALKEAGQ